MGAKLAMLSSNRLEEEDRRMKIGRRELVGRTVKVLRITDQKLGEYDRDRLDQRRRQKIM